MSDDADLYLLFVAEILVIMHLTCDKGIGSSLHSVIEQEIACTTTDRHLPDRALQKLITSGALHLKGLLHQNYEIIGCHRLRQRANHTTAGLDAINRLRGEEHHLLQAQFLGNTEVHTTLGVIHVRMHGDHTDILLDSLSDGTLHIREIADSLQSTEQQRMMGYNQIAPLPDGLVDDTFVDV